MGPILKQLIKGLCDIHLHDCHVSFCNRTIQNYIGVTCLNLASSSLSLLTLRAFFHFLFSSNTNKNSFLCTKRVKNVLNKINTKNITILFLIKTTLVNIFYNML